ncbi:DUF2079 domain-containing protein [Desulfococcaceae bacterium HSG7]|nr:DUF2079 domain-containing protein [Desulfococcaceae bacterium HSG7]
MILFLSLFRHWGYLSGIYDLGIFHQVVWGLVNGESFLNTNVFNLKANWLGIHFQPILSLFIPFYALFPNPIWLTLAQSFCLSVSAVVLFFLARILFKSEMVSFLWVIAYLMNPTLLNAGVYDFSPMTLTVPCIVISMLAIETKKSRLLIVSTLFILLCKEHLGVMAVGFGILWQIKNREWKTCVILLFIGIGHIVLVMGLIMPSLSPTQTHIMFSENMGQLSRYGWLGNSPIEILKTLITHPLIVLKTISLDFGGLKYSGMLLMFFLFFPLAAPEFILPALADLSVNLLSYNSLPRSIFSFHNLSIIPILTVASMYGVKRISHLPKSINRFSIQRLVALLLSVNCLGGYFLAPLPLPGARNIMDPTPFFNLPDPYIQTIRSAIGKNASVTAQANIGSHFSGRKKIYVYPNQVGKADAVILRLESPTKNVNNIPKYLIKQRKDLSYTLDGHLQMDRKDYLFSIKEVLTNNEYGILLWHDPWLVFKKDVTNVELREKIKKKLTELKIKWQTTDSN